MITKPKLSSLVTSQVPEFVRSDYQSFVSFLEAYYEFLDSTQADLDTLKDLDKTLDSFIIYFKNELASKLPYTAVDQRFLMQHIKEHYGAKGSESSYKLLFRILFGKEVTIDYPAKQMLRASDGKWNQDVSLFVKILTGHPNDPIGKLVDVVTPTKIIRVLVDRRQYVELEVDRVVQVSEDIYEYFIDRRFFGNVSVGDRLRYRDDINGIYFTAEILSTTTKLEVQKPGSGFKIGDLYNIQNFQGTGSIMKVVAVNSSGGITQAQFIKFGVGYTTDFTTTISATSGQDVSGTAGTIITRVDTVVGSNILTNLSISERLDGFAESGSMNTADYSLAAQPVAFTGTMNLTANSSAVTGTGFSVLNFGDVLTLPAGNYTVGKINSNTSLVLVSSPYSLTGTINVTYNSTSITGTGTKFTTEVAVGDYLSLPNGLFAVQSITNNTTLVLTSVYSGTSQTLLPVTKVTPTLYGGTTTSGITPTVTTRPPVLDGAFAGIVLREFGISNIDAAVTLSDPAIVKCSLGSLAKYPGYYVNNDGFLDDAIFIQDSRYYQSYSYVIKIDEALDSYKTAVKNLIHPSGMAIFGEYDIRNEFDISEQLESLIKILNITASDSVVTSSGSDVADLTRVNPSFTAPLNTLLAGSTAGILKSIDDQTLNGDSVVEGQYVTMQEIGIALDNTRTMPYLTLNKPIDDTGNNKLNDGVTVDTFNVILSDGGDVQNSTRINPAFLALSGTLLSGSDAGFMKVLNTTHTLNDGTTVDNESVVMADGGDVQNSTRTNPKFQVTTGTLLSGSDAGFYKVLDSTHLNYDLVYDDETAYMAENAIGYGYSSLTRTGMDVVVTTKILDSTTYIHYLNDGATLDSDVQTISDTDAVSASDLNRTIPAFSLTTSFPDAYYDSGTTTYSGNNAVTATDSGGTLDVNPYAEAGWFLNDSGLYVGNPITFTG